MNWNEMKHRINMVGLIAAIGALIALIGIVIAYTEFPDTVKITQILVYVVMLLVDLDAIRPKINVSLAIADVVLSILSVVVAGLVYMNIANYVDAQVFGDVRTGIWMVFFGTILMTVFFVSDLMFKRVK